MLTRSGRYVDPPEVIRRPTIRFAYWIGILRWPSWTNTTAATIAIPISGKKIRSIGPPFHQAVDAEREARQDRREDEDRDAVADPALRDLLAHPHEEHAADGERDDDQHHPAGVRLEDPLVLEEECVAERLRRRQDDGQVARVLVDLGGARLAFLLQLREPRDDDGHQLEDDRRRDVRHDPEREQRELRQRAAGEEVEQVEDPAGARQVLVDRLASRRPGRGSTTRAGRARGSAP